MTVCSSKKNLNVGGIELGSLDSEELEMSGQKIDPENWGYSNTYSVLNNGEDVIYRINTLNFYGTNKGRGILGDQTDGTMTLVSGQRDYNPKNKSISEFFPAYEKQVEYTFVAGYGLLSEDFVFTYYKNYETTIGEYKMHVFEGKLSFMNDITPMNFTFVAYATKLKSNNVIAYWMVFDSTDELNKGNLIREHTYNMALTFREKNKNYS